jgi:endonuclease III
MTSVSRTAQFLKIHKVLKKYYKPAAPPTDRPVLEHLLFGCCLEDARYEAAEEAFAAIQHTFFDWNEVRVTSLSELSEVIAVLPDPRMAANRVKRVLHSIFEQMYSFDLEEKRKKNLGPTVTWLEQLDGTTKFSVAYVVQSALDGHSVPIDAGTMAVLRVLDLATDKDAAEGVVPGLERAIAKAKGVEFGSLLHQLGADYSANPYSPQVRDVLLQIDPEAAVRFPQRRAPPPNRDRASHAEEPQDRGRPQSEGPEARGRAPRGAAAPAPGRKKKTDGCPEAEDRSAAAERTPPAESKKSSPGKKPPGEAPLAQATDGPLDDSTGKATTEGLAKRKPR